MLILSSSFSTITTRRSHYFLLNIAATTTSTTNISSTKEAFILLWTGLHSVCSTQRPTSKLFSPRSVNINAVLVSFITKRSKLYHQEKDHENDDDKKQKETYSMSTW